MRNYKSPLNVFVVWRPALDGKGDDTSLGGKLAHDIYSYLARDVEHPGSHGLGIPVYFRYAPAAEGATTPAPVDLTHAERCAVIVLADSGMVTNQDWKEYVRAQEEAVKTAGGRHCLFPVALTKPARNLSSALGRTNFIRYHEFEEGHEAERLLIWLTHELGRLLNEPRSAEEGAEWSPKPIRLFISHAKQDGVALAESFKEQVEKHTPAKVFFDSIDIAPGYDFGDEIEANIRDATLLVLQSDVYSSRPWCRQEVLSAKRLHRPIVIVNALEQDERRSFPYGGNVPVIRWTGKNHLRVIGAALREHLRFLYTEQRVRALQRAGRIPADAQVLMRSPEMLDFQYLARRRAEGAGPQLVVYPDPPLGAEECNILSSFSPDISFTTLAMPEERELLSNRLVGLSISECGDLAPQGFSKTHLRDTLIEFTRQLLARDANVAYGGHLQSDGFTRQLFDLVRMHNSTGSISTYKPIHNYLAWPLHLRVDEDAEAELDRVAKIIRETIPPDLVADFGVDPQVYVEPDSTPHRYVWARCLTAMREHVTRDADLRVMMGGKSVGYSGKYPGLLEEAYLALRAEKPLFLLGAFGGCTRAIIELVTGGHPKVFSTELQCRDENYKALVAEYNKQAASRPELGLEPVDYEHVCDAFRSAGVAGLRNGLTEEQNGRLFTTVDLDEIIYLVLKGIREIGRPR